NPLHTAPGRTPGTVGPEVPARRRVRVGEGIGTRGALPSIVPGTRGRKQPARNERSGSGDTSWHNPRQPVWSEADPQITIAVAPGRYTAPPTGGFTHAPLGLDFPGR